MANRQRKNYAHRAKILDRDFAVQRIYEWVSGTLRLSASEILHPLLRPITLRLCLAGRAVFVCRGKRLWGQHPARTGRQGKPSKLSQPTEKLSFRPADPLNAAAFDHFYDMDYDASIQEFTQIEKRHPDDPDAINHLLTVGVVSRALSHRRAQLRGIRERQLCGHEASARRSAHL